MTYYIGVIHKDPHSDFGISFPDFPGCISAGSTLEEVMAMGREALTFHMEGMAEDHQPIPAPSPIEAVMADPDFADGTPVLIAPLDLRRKAA
jgi:predicted RNase H-like HicB family nuclease